MSTPLLDRRAFLALCTALPLAGACAQLTFVNGRLDGSRIVVARSALGTKNFALVEVPSMEFPVYLHRHTPDEFTAVLTRCMHRGCTVEPADDRLICPCHGSEYTTRGAILKGPTELPLIKFAVTSDDTNIYIEGAGAPR